MLGEARAREIESLIISIREHGWDEGAPEHEIDDALDWCEELLAYVTGLEERIEDQNDYIAELEYEREFN